MMKKFDFPSFADDHKIPYLEAGHHHCHDGWVQTHCVFCADGISGWHLGHSLDHGNFNCWKCGPHSAYDFLKAVAPKGMNYKTLWHKYNCQVSGRVKKDPEVRTRTYLKPPPNMGDLKEIHRQYLSKRNYDPDEVIDTWGLQATTMAPMGQESSWAWRIIAPIKDPCGDVVAYTGRTISQEKSPRWKTSDKDQIGINPKRILYGIDKVKNTVVIVEGPSDVWRMGPGAVATLGIDWKLEQANILRGIPNRWVLYDPESQAQKRGKELAHWLSLFPGKTHVLTGFKTDPGEFSRRMVADIRKKIGLEK